MKATTRGIMCMQSPLLPLLRSHSRVGILQAERRTHFAGHRCKAAEAACSTRLPSALYLVATPIGNLEDITLRALRVLRTADVIFCEDCRHTRRLLTNFDISTALQSLHQHNEAKRSAEVVSLLQQGQAVALVSDAGTPGISDPGSITVAETVAAGYNVVPIPGPSAVVSGVIASGLSTSGFIFIGFLPPKPGPRRRELAKLRERAMETMIFYVPPHKLHATMADIRDVLGGERKCCIAREVTKKFEQFIRGTIESVMAQLADGAVKGEVTLLVEGSCDEILAECRMPQISRVDRMAQLLADGHSTSEASKMLAFEFTMRKKDAYAIALSVQDGTEPAHQS
eukprot:jgi/Ulvmu1/1841/UM119_0060.1